MNIWEIESQFKCSVVGTMLSVERHKQILKKCGYDVSRMKPYEFHQQLMSRLHEQNNVSIKVNNFIRTQAVKQMKRIQSLGKKQIQTLWEEQLEKGLAGPLMYAIIAHEDTGPDLLQEIYGQVHMQAMPICRKFSQPGSSCPGWKIHWQVKRKNSQQKSERSAFWLMPRSRMPAPNTNCVQNGYL